MALFCASVDSFYVCVCVYFGCSACLGAVLFLPLVDFHLTECVEALCSSAALTSMALPNQPRRLETGFTVEQFGLAALRLLYLLVSHSDEVMFQHQFRLKHMIAKRVSAMLTSR